MADEKVVKLQNVTPDQRKEFPINVKLRDFGGEVVFEMNLKEHLNFPYLFWDGRLFVTSRDNPLIFLERSYHVFMEQSKSNEQH
jgi:hypothetical protein